MRVIIAGSRTINNLGIVKQAIWASRIPITEVVSGGAMGVDSLGELWADTMGIPYKRFKADWSKYGRSAGPIRNRAMAQYAQGLIAIWDGRSRGTKDMIEQAELYGLKIYVHEV